MINSKRRRSRRSRFQRTRGRLERLESRLLLACDPGLSQTATPGGVHGGGAILFKLDNIDACAAGVRVGNAFVINAGSAGAAQQYRFSGTVTQPDGSPPPVSNHDLTAALVRNSTLIGSATVASNGRFNIPVSASSLPNNQTHSLTVTVSVERIDMTQNLVIPNLLPFSLLVDRTAPELQSFTRRPAGTSQLTNADQLAFDILFSETVQNVSSGDFVINGTTATGSVTGSGRNYTITLAGGDLPDFNGRVDLDLAGGQNIADLGGNPLTSVEPPIDEDFLVDNRAPQLTAFQRRTPATVRTNADTLVFDILFDEAVRNVTANDFVILGTTAGGVLQGSGDSYTLTVSGGDLMGLNGEVSLDLVGTQDITDLATNPLAAAPPRVDQGYLVDNRAPRLTAFRRNTPPASLTNADELVFDILFDEPVSSVGADDFVINGTSASGVLNGSGDSYSLTVSGGDLAGLDGTVDLDLAAAASVMDIAGNPLVAVQPPIDEDYTLDNTPPRLTAFRRAAPTASQTNADLLVFEILFDGLVNNVSADDFTITGTSASGVLGGSGSSYTLTVSGGDLPGLSGTVQLDLASGRDIRDAVGNLVAATEPPVDESYILDNVEPRISTLNPPDGAVDVPLATNLVATFDEAVQIASGTIQIRRGDDDSLEQSIAADSGQVSVAGATVTIDPPADLAPDTEYYILISDSAFEDRAGNAFAGIASESVWNFRTVFVDQTLPTVASILRQTPANSPTNADQVTFAVSFSESVQSVDVADFEVTGSAASVAVITGATGSANLYSVTVAGIDSSNGTIDLDIAATATIQDLAGNALNDRDPANEETYVIDNLPPTVEIVVDPPVVSGSEPFIATVTFNEDVVGFEIGDLTITNGSAASFSRIDDRVYRFEVDPDGTGSDVTLMITAAVSEDLAGNLNLAATPVVVPVAPRPLDVVDVAPDPRAAPVSSIDVLLSEPVELSEFTFADLTLTRDMMPIALTAPVLISQLAGSTYRISGLESFTSEPGTYVLTVNGMGLRDGDANPGLGSASDSWTFIDTTPLIVAGPTLDSVDDSGGRDDDMVTRQNRNLTFRGEFVDATEVTVEIGNSLFSESMTATLTGNQFLAEFDFSSVVIPDGVYDVVATATDGINVPFQSPPQTLVIDTTSPMVVDVLDIAPDPRDTPVASIDFLLSEAIDLMTFTVDDLSLTRDGVIVALDPSVMVTQLSGGSYRFTGLSGFTAADGDYSLAVDGSGVSDLAGNAGVGTAVDTWTLDTTLPAFAAPPVLDADDDSGRFNDDAITMASGSLTFSGSVENATSVSVRISDGSFERSAEAILDPDGTYFATFASSPGSPLADGVYSVVAVARRLGLEATSPALTLTVDRTAPPVVSIELAGSSTFTNDATPGFIVNGVQTNASVTLIRDGMAVDPTDPPSGELPLGQSVTSITDQSLPVSDPDATYLYQAFQTDLAGNQSPISAINRVAVDTRSPDFQDLRADLGGDQQLRIADSDLAFDDTVLPVAVTDTTRPQVEFQFTEQQFPASENNIVAELFERTADGNVISLSQATITIVASPSDRGAATEIAPRNASLVPINELSAGQHTVFARLTDSAGNTAETFDFRFFVHQPTAATLGAPSTPVLTEQFFIGATITDPLVATADQFVVDQAIPTGYTINTDRDRFEVLASVTDAATGTTTLTLDRSADVQAGDRVAWLRPWTMSFDKTTQTVWFSNEDGHRVGQFDPATGLVNLYDVSIPDASGQATAIDPHGIFFDFNTHLTPRVWFVYRNTNPGTSGAADNDTPAIAPAGNEVARVSYLETCPLAADGTCQPPKLFTYDFANQTFEPVVGGGHSGGTGHGGTGQGGMGHSEPATVIIHDPRLLPQVDLQFVQTATGGVRLDIDASPFEFSIAGKDGAHVAGQGHAHVYVNGVRVGTQFDDPFDLPSLSPGTHEIIVTLQTNDHASYVYAGQSVGNRATIKINNQNRLADVVVHGVVGDQTDDAVDSGTGNGTGNGDGSGGGGGNQSNSVDAAQASVHDHDSPLLRGAHATFVDAKGDVWITAEESNALIHLDFDASVDGTPQSLDSNSGRILVHQLPETLATRIGADDHSDFHIHGVQVVVDDQTGQQYVYAVDAGEKSDDAGSNLGKDVITGRLVLLIPGDETTDDLWFEWDFDDLLAAEALQDGLTNQTFRDPHLLFTAIYDRETPGRPADDQVLLSDPGFSFTGRGAGILRQVDVGPLVDQISRADPDGRNQIDMLRDSTSATLPFGDSEVLSVRVPSLPGTGLTYSAPVQAFVDRGATLFAADAQGGLARLRMGNQSTADSSVTRVPVTFFRGTAPTLSEIEMGAVFTSHEIASGEPVMAVRSDRSQAAGIDQYEVASEGIRRSAGGPFRAALNAANVIYGAHSQADQVSTTVFAESARRQMASVVSPLPIPSGAITQARMAFQVVSNGTLVLTARGDAKLADDQMNLILTMIDRGTITDAQASNFTIAGEASAVATADGRVHVMGRARSGGVVQFTYTPAGNDWDHDDLFDINHWSVARREMPGVILAEDVVPAESLGFSATTSDGHWLAIPIDPSAAVRDLTTESGDIQLGRVFSGVATTAAGQTLFGYGTNQTGNLVEYQISSSGQVSVRTIAAIDRDHRVLQNVEAITTPDGTRHIFAGDGVSRLVHWEISSAGVQQENISQLTAASGRNFGYFPFQQPFTGRVYTYVEPLVEDDGTFRVYGTNGGELIEFTRPPGGQWRVANLTQDTNGTFGADGPRSRVPANAVFGGPTAYIDSNGGRHILQINAEGEVVEYFTYGDSLFAGDPLSAERILSQNINFFTGKSVEDLVGHIPPADSAVATVAPVDATVPSQGDGSPTQRQTSAVVRSEDVNRDGIVTAQDALLIINRLAVDRLTDGEVASTSSQRSTHDFDVSGDGRITARDALLVINHLARAADSAQAEFVEATDDDEREPWVLATDEILAEIEQSPLW